MGSGEDSSTLSGGRWAFLRPSDYLRVQGRDRDWFGDASVLKASLNFIFLEPNHCRLSFQLFVRSCQFRARLLPLSFRGQSLASQQITRAVSAAAPIKGHHRWSCGRCPYWVPSHATPAISVGNMPRPKVQLRSEEQFGRTLFYSSQGLSLFGNEPWRLLLSRRLF